MNKIMLIGRLTKDPEMRYTPNGTPVANFTLAVDRSFKAADKENEADFIKIIVWSKLAEVCKKYSGKGRLVAVEGRLQIRSYTDQNKIQRTIAEVIANNVQFLDWPKNNGENTSADCVNNDIVTFKEEEIPF